MAGKTIWSLGELEERGRDLFVTLWTHDEAILSGCVSGFSFQQMVMGSDPRGHSLERVTLTSL